MDIQPVERQSIAEEVTAQLRRLILIGEMPAGTRLPAERDLAARFGTNRNTLREALRTLEAQGLVAVRQGAPSEVLDFRASGNLALIPYYFQERVPGAEVGTLVRELFVLRREFLAQVAVEAAEKDGEGRGKVAVALEAVKQARADAGRVMRLDLAFYEAVVASTGSLVYRWAFNSFAPIYHELIDRAPGGFAFPDAYFTGLSKVARAICAGDGKRASRELRRHLEFMDGVSVAFLETVAKEIRESR